MNVRIIAVAGGSGSGKTTLAQKLLRKLGASSCALLAQDSYYIDQSQKFDRDGGAVNFDHPDALEFSLLARHLAELKAGRAVEVPIYDFATHTRKPVTERFESREYVLVDGTLILSIPELLPFFDEAIFVDTDEKTRFERRLQRDVAERGRTPEGVHAQFYGQVKPMHDRFVEPSKSNCSLLVHEHGCTPMTVEDKKAGGDLRARLLSWIS